MLSSDRKDRKAADEAFEVSCRKCDKLENPKSEWEARRVQFGEGHATLVMSAAIEIITSVVMAWHSLLQNEIS